MQPISSRIAAPRRVAALALAGAGLLWLPACATLTIPEERELGKQASGQIAREVRFVRDRAIRSYVSGLGAEILEAAGPQPFDYHFYVIEDDDINAFAAPAGYIYVHTETILRARNVSELTGVLAHEVGHVVKRHIARNYNRQRWTGIFSQFFGVLFSFFIGGYAANAAQMGTELAAIAYINSFGREAEEEADAFAVEVMPVARYDPEGLVSFFRTLKHKGGGANVPGFLSSHPATQDRIDATQSLIAELPKDIELRVTDNGKFEIIQHRIRLLMGREEPGSDGWGEPEAY